MSTRFSFAIAAALSLSGAAGCAKIPPGRSAIDVVHLRGAHGLDEGEVTDRLATAASEKFLGLFRGVVYDYQVYDPTVFQRDLARVTRYYRGHGFLEAHARAGRVEQISPDHVSIEIVVEEGPETKNREVRVDGLDGVPTDVADDVRRAAVRALRKGRRFDEDAYNAARDTVKRALTDRGYAWAAVESDAAIDLGAHEVDYVMTAKPGPRATFGEITIEGLDPDSQGPRTQEIDEKPLRRAIDIKPGTTYSTQAIDSATQALLELEVFSAVEIAPSLPDPPPADLVVPLKVRLEPTRLRQITLGVGAELDQIKTDVHLVGGWEDHNFLGGLRTFSVDFKPGAVLYPTRFADPVVAPRRLLPEERLRLTLRQPSFLEQRVAAFVKPELNVFALLVQPDPLDTDPVVGYLEARNAIGVDRPFGKLLVSVAYNVQVESPFTYIGDLDSALRTIVLSYPQILTTLDLRDDPTHPHSGFYLGNDLQIAGGPFGGDARDIRVQPEARGYIPLGRRVTLAARTSVGLLFPSDYGDVIKGLPNPLPANATPAQIAAARNASVSDIQIVYFRGLFSGGPSSNRGYPVRGIAPYGVVPFLNPATARTQVALNCDPLRGTVDPEKCALPIGGFTLWEASVEARIEVSGPFSVAFFCDASDVSQHTLNIRLDHPHVSCGVGGRYDTPVGPIRLDIGYRIQPLQVIGYPDEQAARRADSVNPNPPTIFGAPLAIAFGIGEAY